MKQIRKLSLTARIGLFILILCLGTMAALMIGEQQGLALTDLSGASVQALAATENSDVIYAALTNGTQPAGIYRSDDSGRIWHVVCSGPGLDVKSLAVHPTSEEVLLAGSRGGPRDTANSTWRSDDGGRNWYPFSLSLPPNAYDLIPTVTALAVDPGQPQTIYIGTDSDGIFRLVERDPVKIEAVNDGLPFVAPVTDLAVGPNERIYAVVNYSLFEFRGDTWQEAEALPEPVVSLGIVPTAEKTLYIGSASGGVYRSDDGGRTWVQMSAELGLIPGAPLQVTALAVDRRDSTHVVAGTAYLVGNRLAGGAIHQSRDGGQHWTKLDDIDGLARQIAIQGDSIFAATTKGLLQFGQSVAPSSVLALPSFDRLFRPTGIQALILMLSAVLAALALLGHIEWVFHRSC
jgi:photosystem II stability/assembly factor-like uncharacterized protein